MIKWQNKRIDGCVGGVMLGISMHSHNQTMLSKLGFADPDKRLPLHDLACQYLSEPENAKVLIEQVAAPLVRAVDHGFSKWSKDGLDFEVKSRNYESFCHQKSSLERAISKGDGQYRTTVGFLDLGISYKYTMVEAGDTKKSQNAKVKPKPFRNERSGGGGIAIEVKITLVSVAEILRQINLYREYDSGVCAAIQVDSRHPVCWVCATDFELSKRDVDTLADARIHHVRLGPRFHEWAKSVDTSGKSAATIEI